MLTAELLRKISSTDARDGLGIGTIDGRLDLRASRLEEVHVADPPREWTVGGVRALETRNVRLEGLRLADLDLRDSDLQGVTIDNSTITNCLFDGAKLTNSSWRRVTVTDSSFDRADLREVGLGLNARDSRFERLTFRKAKLGRSSLSATFVDCDFSRAILVRSEFRDAFLVRCRFAGPLREVAFHAKRRNVVAWKETLEDVDFREAEFHFVEFHHLNLDNVHLPNNDHHVVIRAPRCTLDRAIAALKETVNKDEQGYRIILESHRNVLGPKQEVDIFGVLDFQGDDPSAPEGVIALLRAAESGCLGQHDLTRRPAS